MNRMNCKAGNLLSHITQTPSDHIEMPLTPGNVTFLSFLYATSLITDKPLLDAYLLPITL